MRRRYGWGDLCAAYAMLIVTQLLLAFGGFGALYRFVRNLPVRRGGLRRWDEEMARVMAAVDGAAHSYFRRVRCLQHSAAAVCLLRLRRVPASLVIGVRTRPFLAHAWVEVGDALEAGVKDKSRFAIIDRI